MAASVASESILFIAAIIAATAVATILGGLGNSLSEDLRVQGDAEAAALRSDIVVINDPGDVDRTPDLILYLKNTGTVPLSTADTSLIIDGVLSEDVTYDVMGSTDDETWLPGEVVEATVNDIAVGSGDHRVRATAETGAPATFYWSG